ncbi:hypothetical protein [Hymenobacter jejuensis]|uniref:Uncharacterized protein n=1 Tax=Hymenobacter jejuensis TaxID=2502781 RepID=A0A5B8A5K1_9BACT|nr:hypothetical protein [Hymenobacter jejuensis]QDA61885.1 hypothetical protein FHG12_18065 [Hymenobacter jejuensis]
MNEKAPTRKVGYRSPNGTITYIDQPIKWVNPSDKTVKQVLLEIGHEMYECRRKKEDVEDLLTQAHNILWREFQDDNHSLYQFINEQIKHLRTYDKQRSQTSKGRLLEDIAREGLFRIKHYFEMGDR